MDIFQTVRRAFVVALFLLYLGAGMALRADETVSENFDSFPPGGFISLNTALGAMTADSGHAAIANNRHASQSRYLPAPETETARSPTTWPAGKAPESVREPSLSRWAASSP